MELLKLILDKLLTSSNKLRENTGIANDSLFQWILSILSLIRSDVPSIIQSFAMDNHLLWLLMKLRLEASSPDFSLRLTLKRSMCSKLSELLTKVSHCFCEPNGLAREKSFQRKLAYLFQDFYNVFLCISSMIWSYLVHF